MRPLRLRLIRTAVLILSLAVLQLSMAALQTQSVLAADFTVEPYSQTLARDLRTRVDTAEDRILILTPGALYRFLAESEAWTVATPADGLPDAPFQGFSLTGGSIWICGDGVSVSDLRFDDWQRYMAGEGYPGRFVFDVEADEDYAYAGTDEGAARFDRYILEWETLDGPDGEPLGAILDVAVGEDRVWFALEEGIAEYRKESESFRVDSLLGQLQSPKVLALRQSSRFLWAVTGAGIARYDKDLESWTSFLPGIDLPNARVHQLSLQGDDLWLGTDDGLWRYRFDTGIWRRDESGNEMPGQQARAFALGSDGIWVVTERAFALYEEDAARWIDFTSSIPLPPHAVREMSRSGETIVFVGEEKIVYGLAQGQENPSLFTYRSRPILESRIEPAEATGTGWWLGLDDAGLTMKKSSEFDLHVKGGATIFVEDYDQDGEPGLGDLLSETRLDITLSGRHETDRTLSGLYDSTDPDNSTYQLTYRGARSDVLRVLSLGEIEQQLFNSSLVPGTGLRGGWARAEAGGRLEKTRRRLLTADGWIGERRTVPGRDTFYGGNRTVQGETRDTDYVQRQVFSLPDGWTGVDLRNSVIYLDDNDTSTDGANTEHRKLAGIDGAWDRLQPNADYVIGPGGTTLILVVPLEAGQALVAAGPDALPPGFGEVDLSARWLRNHYWIAMEPVPGSLALTLVDATGSSTGESGKPYMEIFGLDANGDGLLDPERFSPISGLLSFPDSLPFPPEVYGSEPTSLFRIEFTYQTELNTFQLSHRDLVPQSERITVDRSLLKPGTDYSIIPSSGLFILFEHVLLDEDTLIEVEYLYEVDDGSPASIGSKEDMVFGGQIGFAPDDRIFVGGSATRWNGEEGLDVTTAGMNARFEWKDEESFLRLTPELATSQVEGGDKGEAAGLGFQGRYRKLEVSASHRSLGGDYVSFEDRRTLLGRLREESSAWGRFNISRHLQAELEWDESRSDKLTRDGTFASGPTGGNGSTGGNEATSLPGRGKESSLMASLRLLRSGWPNLEVRRGRVVFDIPGRRQEKHISRAELELSPEQAGVDLLGIRRLWLRAFIQRSERELEEDAAADTLPGLSSEKRTTDHAFLRLNGSLGSPLSWNVAFEDRLTFLPEAAGEDNLRRFQAIDATLQTQPHSSLDAFLSWESDRDLFWHPEGGGGGFGVRRLLLATIQLYPGRIATELSRLSFRFDVGSNETDKGEPGVELPGGGSLFTESSDASERRRVRNRIIEARVQIRPRIRLIERWEIQSDETTREGLRTEGNGWRLENRLEIRPHGGLLILRAIGADSDNPGADDEERRFSGQWDQAWGRGILTYLSLEAKRIETRDRSVGQLNELWNPEVRVTLRRARWQLDASLGGSLTWNRTKDISSGTTGGWNVTREQSLTAQLSLQPWRILSLKVQYWLNRFENGQDASGKVGEIDHDLRLRFQIRA